MPSARRTVTPLDAYVLHRYDWSETSLVLDLFTRSRGRLAVAAKGAKRPYSQLRTVLLPFQRLHATVGRQAEEAQADVLTLRSAEWSGDAATPVLPAARLFAGFYLNELLMKLLARGDPAPALFDIYAETLRGLAFADETGEQVALRAFELLLLRAIGLLPELDRVTATQQPVRADGSYQLHGSRGVIDADPALPGAFLSGADLAVIDEALRRNDEAPAELRRACALRLDALRPVLRGLVHYHLGTPVLRTRDVMRDARQLLGLPTPASPPDVLPTTP
jgi:DNA repair protein RecO (recombination protein O)